MRLTFATRPLRKPAYPDTPDDHVGAKITTPLVLLSMAVSLGAAGALLWVFALRPLSSALIDAVKLIEAESMSTPTRPRSPNAPELRRSKG